jgi:hypothetical protein
LGVNICEAQDYFSSFLKRRQAPVYTTLTGFLLYNHIYFNDLRIYVIGVY